MDFVYCPNGHANRPGTRICAVCRALIEQRAPQSAAAPSSRRSSVPHPVETSEAAPFPDATSAAAPPGKKGNRLWLWLLLLLGLLGLTTLAILAFFYPLDSTGGEQPTPPVKSTTAVVVIDPTKSLLPTPAMEALPPPTESFAQPTAVSTITPSGTIIGVVITPTFTFGPDSNMLQNGEFADDWANGWSSEANGESGLAEVRPLDDEPGVNALHLEQTGPGYLKIAQRVVLTYPVEGLEFQARIRTMGTAGGVAEGRSALILRYEGFNGEPIGASIWLDSAAGSTELLDALLSLPPGVPVAGHTLEEGWQTLTANLGREFAEELAELNPIDVAQLTVIMVVVNSDACETGSCTAALDVAALSLAPNLP